MFSSGTFITDGCVFGLVLKLGTLKLGRRNVPAYLVDIGGGRTSAILCRCARAVE